MAATISRRQWLQGIGAALLLGVLVAGGLRSGGDVVERGVPMPAVAATPSEATFTVVTYNVQARPWMDDAQEKLPKISPLLAGFDIVANQECFHQRALLWESAKYPNRAYFGNLAHPFKLVNSGLSLMGRLPMGEVVMEHYAKQGEWQNRISSKGVVMARFAVAGWTVDVYNTHMEAGGLPAAQPARMAQALQMVDMVKRYSPPAHGFIVTGDFNMMPLRKDKTPEQYSPGHFDSIEDLHGRTAAFQAMIEGLGARDASDELFGPVHDDIERFLFRAPEGAVMTPLSLRQDTTNFVRADGSRLSDGNPYIAEFRIAPAATPMP